MQGIIVFVSFQKDAWEYSFQYCVNLLDWNNSRANVLGGRAQVSLRGCYQYLGTHHLVHLYKNANFTTFFINPYPVSQDSNIKSINPHNQLKIHFFLLSPEKWKALWAVTWHLLLNHLYWIHLIGREQLTFMFL